MLYAIPSDRCPIERGTEKDASNNIAPVSASASLTTIPGPAPALPLVECRAHTTARRVVVVVLVVLVVVVVLLLPVLLPVAPPVVPPVGVGGVVAGGGYTQ
jgi:hypothetical protein